MSTEPTKYNVGVYEGLGRPEVVLAAWADALGDLPEIGHDIREAQRVMVQLLSMPDTAKIVVSFCCSVLNRDYRDTGIAFAVNAAGQWGWTAEEDTLKRTAIWDGLINLKY